MIAVHIPVRTRILRDFEDATFGPEEWEKLLRAGDTDVVFLSWQWQKIWWQCFGRGELLLIVAEKEGRPVAIAPFFTEAGMVFFVGSGGSDYLDFIGDIRDPEVLDALLLAAYRQVPDFVGFRFYHVPDDSPTGRLLDASAERLGFDCVEEGYLPNPVLGIAGQTEIARAAADKKHLRRREHFLRREGRLEVRHLQGGEQILPHLPAFFEQHITRWAETPYPSAFRDPVQRRFYEELTRAAADTGWLRFTRIDWDGRPIAFHFGFCYRGSYLCYKVTYAMEMAQRAPGQVLFRQLILAAIEEGAGAFDFGLGDEEFKFRFATSIRQVHTWGLYPAAECAPARPWEEGDV